MEIPKIRPKNHRCRTFFWQVTAPRTSHLTWDWLCLNPPPLVDMCFTLAWVPATYDSCWKHIWNSHLYSSFLRKLPNLAVLLAPLDRSQWARPDGRGGINSTITLSNAWKMLASEWCRPSLVHWLELEEGELCQAKAMRSLCSWRRPPSQISLHSRAPCQVGRHSCGIREVVQEEKEVSNSAKEQLLESELGESGGPKQGQESWNKVHVARSKDLSNYKI